MINPSPPKSVSARNTKRASANGPAQLWKLSYKWKFFKVTPRRDDYLVTWGDEDDREKEIRLWFKERGHQAGYIDGQRSKGRYVKCSKAIALLAKLTWGGAQ